MLKLLLKVLTFVAVIFLILFMLMWGFHGFATKPTRDLPDPEHSLVMPHSTEQKLQAFLTDPSLELIKRHCIPAYNAEIHALQAKKKDQVALIRPEDLSFDLISQVNPQTGVREVNDSQVAKILSFFNDLDPPAKGNDTLLAKCFTSGDIDEYRALKLKLNAFVRSYQGLD